MTNSDQELLAKFADDPRNLLSDPVQWVKTFIQACGAIAFESLAEVSNKSECFVYNDIFIILLNIKGIGQVFVTSYWITYIWRPLCRNNIRYWAENAGRT